MHGNAHQFVQMIAVAVAVGILAQFIASRARLPSVVFLLAFGVVIGTDVMGWIDTSAFGAGLQAIVAIAVALILFEGGLQLHYLDLALVGRTVRNLVTIGAAVTVIGATLIAHLIVGFPWPLALLYGSIVSVTGPTVINPILDRVRVVRPIDTVLRGEGILIDPIGAILAVVVLEFVLTAESSVWDGLLEFGFRMLAGVLLGVTGGLALGRILRVHGLIPQELKNLFVLAWVLMLFAAAQSVAPESGLAAVVIAGMIIRRESIPQQHLLRRFKGELSILFISILFILLSAHLPLAMVEEVGWRGVVAVLALIWVVRPLSVLAASWKSSLTWRERLFVMWISPRGVVAISIASFVVVLFQDPSAETIRAGLTSVDGEGLLALVFLTIAISVTIQGMTASIFARLLGVRAGDRKVVVVVGANSLGRTLSLLLQAHGVEPVLIDSNGGLCIRALRDGLTAIRGNCLDRDVLESARIAEAAALVAATSNQETNLLVSRMAGEEYHVPQVFPVLSDPDTGPHEILVEEIGGNLAFGRPLDVTSWSEDLSAGRAVMTRFVVGEKAPRYAVGNLVDSPDAVLLLIVRQSRPIVCHAGLRLLPGDEVFAIVRNEGQDALMELFGAPAVTARPHEVGFVRAASVVGSPSASLAP